MNKVSLNKVLLLTILFSFFINHVTYAMQNGSFQPLVNHFKKNYFGSFNLKEYKALQTASKEDVFPDATIITRDGEENPYLLLPIKINEHIRPLFLKKIEDADAIENVKTTFALSSTCKYMHVHLNEAIKEQEKNIIKKLLFSNLNHDFCTLNFNCATENDTQALYLYNTFPKTLAFMGKILVSTTIPYQKYRGVGDRNYYDWYSYRKIRTAFFNLLDKHIVLTDTQKMENHNQLKGDIIKKLLKGIPSNEWHEMDKCVIENNQYYPLNNNPFIITETRTEEENNLSVQKYFFMKKESQKND